MAVPARTRVRCGPREQRERERGDELEHFYHKSQQLGSAHSIFSKTLGGAAAIASAKPPSPKSSSQWTPRWREPDANHRFLYYDQYRIGLKKAGSRIGHFTKSTCLCQLHSYQCFAFLH